MVLVSCGANLQKNKTIVYSTKNLEKLEIEYPSSFLATTADYQTRPIPPNSVLIGYLIDGYESTNAQFDEMSHIAISFLQAIDSTGDISMTSGWENLDKVIAAAHAKNVKVIISFGGGGFKVTTGLMGIKENRQNLIKNIILDWHAKKGKEKRDVMGLLGSILHFTEDEKDKAYIGESHTALEYVYGAVAAPLPKSKLDADKIEGDTVREKWVNFLLAETGEDGGEKPAAT